MHTNFLTKEDETDMQKREIAEKNLTHLEIVLPQSIVDLFARFLIPKVREYYKDNP